MHRLGIAAVLLASLLAGCAGQPEVQPAVTTTVTATTTMTPAPSSGNLAAERTANATVRIYCFCYAFSAVIDNGDDVWWLRGFNTNLTGNASWGLDWVGAPPLNVTMRDLNLTIAVPGNLVAVKVGVGSSPSTCSSPQGAVSVAIRRGGRPVAIMSDSSGCPTVRLQG